MTIAELIVAIKIKVEGSALLQGVIDKLREAAKAGRAAAAASESFNRATAKTGATAAAASVGLTPLQNKVWSIAAAFYTAALAAKAFQASAFGAITGGGGGSVSTFRRSTREMKNVSGTASDVPRLSLGDGGSGGGGASGPPPPSGGVFGGPGGGGPSFLNREAIQRLSSVVNKLLLVVTGLNAALWVTVARAMNAGQALKQFAVSTGLSTENLQRAQFAAGQFGVAAEDVAGALKNLQKQKALLAIGEGDIQPYALLGLDPLDKPEETLRNVAKLIRETREEDLGLVREMTSRIGIGDALFASMRRQNAEMDKSLVLTKEEIDLLADGKAAWSTLLLTISAFTNKLMVALQPALIGITKAFSQVVVAVTRLTQRFPTLTKVVLGAFVAGLVGLTAALLGASAAIGVLGVAAVLATPGVTALAGSVLAATWPILAIVAAIVGFTLQMAALYLVLDDIANWFQGNRSLIGDWFNANVDSALEAISRLNAGIPDWVKYLTPMGLGATLGEAALSTLGRDNPAASQTSNNTTVQISVDGADSPRETAREVRRQFDDLTKTMVASPAVNR